MARSLNVIAGIIAIIIGSILLGGKGGVTPPKIPLNSPTKIIPPWAIFKPAVALNELFIKLARLTTPPNVQVIQMATAYWKSEILYTLVKQGIIDAVSSPTTKRSCEDVAALLNLKSMPTCEYMKAGAKMDILSFDPSDKTYSLTQVGKLVQSDIDAGGILKDFTLMINEETRDAWRMAGMKTIKSGVSGFKEAFKEEWWEWNNHHPVQEAQFDRAMTSFSYSNAGAILSDWKPHSSKDDAVICDVGGGVGTIMTYVLQHYPKMKGIVFDQVSVSKRAKKYLEDQGVSDRSKAIGGNFLKPFPSDLNQCDIFMMKFILHDWPDDECIQILQNIKKVAKPGSKVVIIEHITDIPNAPESMELSRSLMSVNMIAANQFGAKERNIDEYNQLFNQAGFDTSNGKHIPTRDIVSIYEVPV
jgi:ubiquinone/menaquinone biosynthesis C-methylase UbiE